MMLIDSDSPASPQISSHNHRRDLLFQRSARAAELVDMRPDDAALLLEGLLNHIACEWEARLGLEAVLAEERLAQIERAAPLVGWRLRLALRAPNVHARLVACQALLKALYE